MKDRPGKPVKGLARIAISIDAKLMDRFDRSIEEKGYTNRSEAIRDLIRDHLVERPLSLEVHGLVRGFPGFTFF